MLIILKKIIFLNMLFDKRDCISALDFTVRTIVMDAVPLGP